MRLTLVHPCIGRRRGQPYIRSWQMEPLAPATLAGLTPKSRDTQIRFYDDRTESIPFDEPTDLVAMSVETYTAKRSYQIASEYRRRGIRTRFGRSASRYTFPRSSPPNPLARRTESILSGHRKSGFVYPCSWESVRQVSREQAAPSATCGYRAVRAAVRCRDEPG